MGESSSANPQVSVIIPVYNTQQYLPRCMQSILAQTLEDIEVILVDDGSTDGSGDVCDQWAARDARVRVIHKQNGGLSDARNCGAQAARAPYIGFLDSDDSVDPEMYATLLADLQRMGADIVTCDVVDIEEGHEAPAHIDASSCTVEVLSAEEAMKRMVCSGLPRIWVPTRLYPAKLFADGFRFPVGKNYEDAATLVEIFSTCKTVAVSNAQFYCYYHRSGSITSSSYNAHTADVIDAWEHTAALARDAFPSVAQDVEFRLLWARCIVLDKMIRAGGMDGSDEEAELISYIKGHFTQVANHPCMTRNRKMLCKLLRVSTPLYRAAVRRLSA